MDVEELVAEKEIDKYEKALELDLNIIRDLKNEDFVSIAGFEQEAKDFKDFATEEGLVTIDFQSNVLVAAKEMHDLLKAAEVDFDKYLLPFESLSSIEPLIDDAEDETINKMLSIIGEGMYDFTSMQDESVHRILEYGDNMKGDEFKGTTEEIKRLEELANNILGKREPDEKTGKLKSIEEELKDPKLWYEKHSHKLRNMVNSAIIIDGLYFDLSNYILGKYHKSIEHILSKAIKERGEPPFTPTTFTLAFAYVTSSQKNFRFASNIRKNYIESKMGGERKQITLSIISNIVFSQFSQSKKQAFKST